jgi:hypothetical protein
VGWRSQYGALDYAPRRRTGFQRHVGFQHQPPRFLGTSIQGSVTAEFQAQLQGKLSQLSSDATAQLQAQTGIDVNNARVQQGAMGALSIAQHGYNPGDPADNAKLVHAIAGGLALAVPLGTILGAYVELMWDVGNAAACPLLKVFSSIGLTQSDCDSPPCATSGNWSAGALLLGASQSHGLPPMPTGSFASFVVPALAEYLAQADNCKGGFPPSVVVDAAVNIWNATHAGPAVDLYVPPLSPFLTGVDIIPHGNTTGCLPNGVCDTDPNVAYAFAPLSSTYWGVISQSPSPPPFTGFVGGYDPARVVSVNSGPAISASKAITMHLGPGGLATTSSSVATKVLVGTAVVGGGVLASAAVFAWMKKRALTSVLQSMWDHSGGRALKAVL